MHFGSTARPRGLCADYPRRSLGKLVPTKPLVPLLFTAMAAHAAQKGRNIMTNTNHIKPKIVAFVDQRELSAARQALKAMHDAINLKREIGLPVLPETRESNPGIGE